MNAIIIYSSKYGCTADCAKYLKSGLSGSVTLTDIDHVNSISIDRYDTVILGSSIYIGRISKKLQQFCNENTNLLIKKRVGLFLCCAFSAQTEKYLTENFASVLLKSAAAAKGFGGEARIDKMKFMDKLIMKAAMKSNHEPPKISQEDMDSFIKELNK